MCKTSSLFSSFIPCFLSFPLYLFICCHRTWDITQVGLELAILLLLRKCCVYKCAANLWLPTLDHFYWPVFKLVHCSFFFSFKFLLNLPSALKMSVWKFLISVGITGMHHHTQSAKCGGWNQALCMRAGMRPADRAASLAPHFLFNLGKHAKISFTTISAFIL